MPAGYVALEWWWSDAAQDNILTTAAFPPDAAGDYGLVGVIGYGLSSPAGGDGELKLFRAGNGTREYWTTASVDEEQAARAAGYAFVGALGAQLPAPAPAPDPRPLPPSTNTNMPAGEAAGWAQTLQLFSAARGDHYSTPEAFLPGGYVQQRAQGLMNVQPDRGAGCASGSGVGAAQGFAVLSGSGAFNLSVEAAGLVPHPPFPLNLTLEVPPPYGLYPSTSFVADGRWVIGYYLLADPNGAVCSNWCHLGPFIGFAVSSSSSPALDGWSLAGAPLWDGAGPPRGVFEPLSVAQPVRLGVPRFVDLGVDLQFAPGNDGRAYLLGKGCAHNNGLCSFMTGDSAFLARTRRPFAQLAPAGANASALARALNDDREWEFSAGADAGWVADLADAQPLFEWPTGVVGITMTFNAVLARFIVVVNIPSDRIHPTDCDFDTYVLEGANIQGPFNLVSYMAALGPQMYFQQIASSSWSSDGLTGALFSSGNWDGSCVTQGSNPPGERYGLVTTQFSLVPSG